MLNPNADAFLPPTSSTVISVVSSTATSTVSSSTPSVVSSTVTSRMTTLPQFSGKHRKSKINNENPEKEFLQGIVDTLKATIAKNDLEMKKLKESNEIKAKRIMNLESQIEEAKNTITKHKCPGNGEEMTNPSPFSQFQFQPPVLDGYQQIKVANLENRTSSIEHNISVLTSKLENLQFNLLVEKKRPEKSEESIIRTHEVQTFVCNFCEYETTVKALLRTHIATCSSRQNMSESRPKNPEHLDCQKCSYKAIHTHDLSRHEKQMHSPNGNPEVYGCEKCECSTQHENKLRKHIQVHHEQQSRYFYRQKVARKPKEVIFVKRNECTSNTPLNCSSCDYTTKSVGELRKHKSKHVGQTVPIPTFPGPTMTKETEKNWNLNCHKCNSNFFHQDEHKLHMEYFHSSIKVTNQQ